jgi:protein-tyrosine kinase
MDPLQEAIEKARQEREGEIGQTASPGENVKPGQQAPADSAVVENQANTGPYTQATPRTAAASPAAQVQQPESAQEAPAAPQPAPATPKQAPAAPKQEDSAFPLPQQVRYSATRTVEPEEEALSQNRVIAGQIHDPRVEDYRQLRSQVLESMKRNNWHSLAITSAQEGAGKTLTALNLAISISQDVNQTVVLVDLDLRKPNVHTTLDIEIDNGILDHLKDGEPLENIMLNPGYPRLVVIPGLPQGRSSSEMLSSPEMKRFLLDISSRYPNRIIIFDLPPLLRNDDAMVFVPNADACLLVVEDGATTPAEIERSLQLLKQTQLIGTILNKAR